MFILGMHYAVVFHLSLLCVSFIIFKTIDALHNKGQSVEYEVA